jgi:hypothetical protein
MKNELMTSMGPVIMKVEMNFIYLSTQDPHYPEIVLNMWDEKSGKTEDLGGFKELLETILDALENAFENFEYYGIVGEEEFEDDSILA